MPNKMLIDASHAEETRVVVVRGNRVEEFDFESEHKKQLKGNIYLAKVTRVEPSLQAAFVEYGGGRHGFLAFSEIHPDYYQIPKADREALLAEELARGQADDDEDDEVEERGRRKPRARSARREDKTEDKVSETAESDDADPDDTVSDHGGEDGSEPPRATDDNGAETTDNTEPDEDDRGDEETSDDDPSSDSDDDEGKTSARSARGSRKRGGRRSGGRGRSGGDDDQDSDSDDADQVDEIGSEDALEEVPVRKAQTRKNYKIQEVIKRRQILLVQVVKEERGNKGAALTTYLSLAGRYSVLMPNTARGGGISRKITNQSDRKRLRDVVKELEVPRGMGIILRTAGANRTKAEVKRDYEYLMRLWESVRTLTLQSVAPTLVYEEGSLIKRSIRDLYNKDIDQILVAGEAGYREAKDFMRMLMPSQSKAVQPYRDPTPIFARQGIEGQLDKMLQPHVTLKSGGYIIINQTEALVAIDVNSGRSTREMSIENTAYQTNLEAAEEIARQLRLRDLAGLVVVDFIDMDEKRNNRAVEKKMKDCLKNDRARIQVGKISHFGLMEMSRQRIRASVLESTMRPCPVCEGAGLIRATSSLALHAIRHIEEYLQKNKGRDLVVKVPTETALFILNEKRHHIDELEQTHDLRIFIEADPSVGHNDLNIEQGEAASRPVARNFVSPISVAAEDEFEEVTEEEENDEESSAEIETASEESEVEKSEENGERASKGRGRRRRRGKRAASDEANGETNVEEADGETVEAASASEPEEDDDSSSGRRRRRRGRRGGRRHRDSQDERQAANGDSDAQAGTGDAIVATAEASEAHVAASAAADEKAVASTDDAETPQALEATPSPADERFDDPVATLIGEAAEAGAPSEESVSEEPVEAEPAVEVSSPDGNDAPVEAAQGDGAAIPAEDAEPEAVKREPLDEPLVTSASVPGDDDAEDARPRRTGWWSRGFF